MYSMFWMLFLAISGAIYFTREPYASKDAVMLLLILVTAWLTLPA
jgi:hypothetical protein